MGDLQSAVESWVASLDPVEARALWLRTREPTEPVPEPPTDPRAPR
jgi:hypothetical protein